MLSRIQDYYYCNITNLFAIFGLSIHGLAGLHQYVYLFENSIFILRFLWTSFISEKLEFTFYPPKQMQRNSTDRVFSIFSNLYMLRWGSNNKSWRQLYNVDRPIPRNNNGHRKTLPRPTHKNSHVMHCVSLEQNPFAAALNHKRGVSISHLKGW